MKTTSVLDHTTYLNAQGQPVQTAGGYCRYMVWTIVGFLIQAPFLGSCLATPFQRVVWREGFEGQNISLQWQVTKGLWFHGQLS